MADRVTWTPTASEQAAFVRAMSIATIRNAWVVMAIAVALIVACLIAPVFGAPRSMAGRGALLFLLTVCLVVLQQRRIARGVRMDYPVGQAASAEALSTGLRTVSAVGGPREYSWSLLSRPRTKAAAVVLNVGRAGLLVLPRQLFPDGWLDRVGGSPNPP